MKKIILMIFCLGMLFPLLGSAARPYGVEEIPNVQVGNRYRFTSNPDGVLSPSAVAEIDSLCYSLRHRALAQVAVVAVEDIRGDDLFSFAHEYILENGLIPRTSDHDIEQLVKNIFEKRKNQLDKKHQCLLKSVAKLVAQ